MNPSILGEKLLGTLPAELEQSTATWWERNARFVIPILAVWVVIVLCGAMYLLTQYPRVMLKQSSVYSDVVAIITTDPLVTSALGDPIEVTSWLPTGGKYGATNHEAMVVEFDIAGPNGAAHVYANAINPDGFWEIDRLEVAPETGNPIDLVLKRG